jgi:hypothetical protein
MGEGESGMSQLSSKELISELRALDLPGVAPIARAAAAEIERLQATNVPKNGDVYLALVRSGYSQHEAHEIASMVESMQCQRHDCEVMRDELQELRAVHEPKALRASIEGLAEAYERQSSISAAHGGHSAEAWQTVADDLRSLLEQEGAAVPPSDARVEALQAALFECFCSYGDGPVHEERITRLLPNDGVTLDRFSKEIQLRHPWYGAAQPPSAGGKVCDDKLEIIHEHGQPHGIRDRGGYLFFFPRVSKYSGQEERYRNELAERFRLADFLLAALQSTSVTKSEKP